MFDVLCAPDHFLPQHEDPDKPACKSLLLNCYVLVANDFKTKAWHSCSHMYVYTVTCSRTVKAIKVYRDADSEEHHQWRGTVCPVGMEKKVLAYDEKKKSIAEGRILKLARFYELLYRNFSQ